MECHQRCPEEMPSCRISVHHARSRVSPKIEEGMKQLFDTAKSHLAAWVCMRGLDSGTRGQTERPLPPLESPLRYAATFCLHSIVKFLALKHPQDVHSRATIDMSTLLHEASDQGYVVFARLLLEHDADVTAKRKRGAGGLARLLIQHCADLTVRYDFGSTPLEEAVKSPSVDLARLLVEYGANVAAQDILGGLRYFRAFMRESWLSRASSSSTARTWQ